jgi:uncharacterized protein YecT (DUF1311 family)
MRREWVTESFKNGHLDRSAGLLAVIALLSFSSNVFAQQARPSFDCGKASTSAEKSICVDSVLAEADIAIAESYASALKRLDAPARKALQSDQRDFVSYRDSIADLNVDTPKDKQNIDLGEFMRDRATFLASIKTPSASFVGIWKSVQGQVTIKLSGRNKVEIAVDIADPISGGRACNFEGTVKAATPLKFVDKDENDKRTGFVYFSREGDALVMEEDVKGKGDGEGLPSCGANGQASGTFFLTMQK